VSSGQWQELRFAKERREFVWFLSHTEGSLVELDTQLTLAVELGYWRLSDAHGSEATIAEPQKMIASLRGKLAPRLATND
jgi:four helix bundle protein